MSDNQSARPRLVEDEDAQVTEFEGMACPACTRLHFVNRKTGELLGARSK
jgi:hypothetical protein